MATTPNSALEVQSRMRALSARDLQLWSIGLLIVLVLAAGFAALAAPDLMWSGRPLLISGRYLPQLFFGFIVLIVLFNVYVLEQRRQLNAARQELISEFVSEQRVNNPSLVDPLTQIFNRRYLDYALAHEVARALRHSTPLSFVLLQLHDLRAINSRQGHAAGDEMLSDAARLLRGALYPADILLRYSGDQFLAILPDCSADQAEAAARRWLKQVADWNQEPGQRAPLAFNYATSTQQPAGDARVTVTAIEDWLVREHKRLVAQRQQQLLPQCLLLTGDRSAVEVLRQVCETLGIHLVAAGGTVEGLKLLSERPFEAVIVDSEADPDGAFAGRVRTLPAHRRKLMLTLIPAAESSARTPARPSAPPATQGAAFVLEKPLSPALAMRSLHVAQTLMPAGRN